MPPESPPFSARARDPAMRIHMTQTEHAASALGYSVRPIEVERVEDFEGIFAALKSDRPDALIAFTDSVIFLHRQRIVDFARDQRLATVFEFREFTVSGGLMSYGNNLVDIYRRAADYATSNSRRRQARRFACRASKPLRASSQLECSDGARALNSKIATAEGGRGDSVAVRRVLRSGWDLVFFASNPSRTRVTFGTWEAGSD